MTVNNSSIADLPLQNCTEESHELIYKPCVLNINHAPDFIYFKSICENAIIVDKIYQQLQELMKKRNPKNKFSAEEYAKRIDEHLNGASIDKYGLWIYYSWSNKLIHTLNENEFIELRTIRNCYKIMPEEQTVLMKKIIGVVGLSVGHAIALTIASERICGELRLADYDTLDLTNLNRIKTGIQNLSLKKTVIAAREIAEIDPFIKVKCYHDRINDDNILDFLTKDGKIDLCLEECDDFYVKFAMRYACRDLGIPVVMDTSDSGLIDIERFDLEPERKIFHGLSTTTNIEALRNLSTDEKIPYLYEIINENDMSVRLRASLVEIDETITGWPQLSSAVTYGSGITIDVARRILLGQLSKSGRFSMDVERAIKNDEAEKEEHYKTEKCAKNFSVKSIINKQNCSKSSINPSLIKSIVSDAICAPSGGNNQPWKWISKGNSLVAVLDKKRISTNIDFNNWASILALGCSIENAILSANKFGLNADLKILDTEEKDFAAELVLNKNIEKNSDNIYDAQLADYIKLRQTNRKLSPYKPLLQEHKRHLITSVHSIPRACIKLIENRDEIAKVADIIAEGDVIRFLNKFLYHELMSEIRWDKNEALEKPYGIEIDSLEVSPKDKVGLKIFNSWEVVSLVKKFGGKALGDISRKQILEGSGLALITMPSLNKNNFFNGGRAVERFWLTATKYNVAIHPFTALSYFFMRLKTGLTECFDAKEIQTLKALRKRWEEIFNSTPDAVEIFLCKISYSERSQESSRRLAVSDVLEFI